MCYGALKSYIDKGHNTSYCTKWSVVIVLLHSTNSVCTNSYLHSAASVKLLCHILFVWHHCNGSRKRLAVGISLTARIDQIPFNMKTCRAIWWFITTNELYGFIILYKTINVIKYIIACRSVGNKNVDDKFSAHEAFLE